MVLMCLCVGAAGLLTAAPAFAEACPNEAARTGPSVFLPECRAYELVTEVDKSTTSQDLDFELSEDGLAAADGNRLALEAKLLGLGQTPQPSESFVIYSRTASGWQDTSVPPPNAGPDVYSAGPGGVLFTPDLTELASIETHEFFYPYAPGRSMMLGPPGGPFTTMVTENIQYERTFEEPSLLGATPSFSSVFFDSRDHALAGSMTGTDTHQPDVYRWEAGKLSVVNAGAEGSPGPCGAEFKAVSEDGSKVFFLAPDATAINSSEPGCQEPPGLYVREGDSTVDISKGLGRVEFKGASQDGSKVFFNQNGGPLFVYDTLTSTLTKISGGAPAGAAFPSQDGVRVYFGAGEKLTPEAPEGGGVYRYNTETGETHFITAMQSFSDRGYEGEVEGDGGANMRPSPNGKYLIYFGEQDVQSNAERQVFRYDDENEQVTCVSCLPAGAPRDKPSEDGTAQFPIGEHVFHTYDLTPLETFVTNEGAVFFESTTQLVPQAVNVSGGTFGTSSDNTVSNSDVYEWHNGVITLISSPGDQYPQALIGVSENGSDVFFDTHTQLVPQDIDNSGDIYDARVDGGFPVFTASTACQGDTCLHLPPALNDPTPGSLSFTGPGNPPVKVIEPKQGGCKRGDALKHGKCVKRKGTAKKRKGKAKKAARRGARRAAADGVTANHRGGVR